MKRSLRWFYKTLILAAGVILSACGSSSEEATPDPKDFPSFEDLTVLVGDNGSLKFNASSAWTISADKIWFKLSQETGAAGAQTLNFEITDGGIGFQDQTAVITFAMGGRTTSFKATRIAKERSLTMLTYVQTENGLEPQETEQIDLAYAMNSNAYISNFAVRANYAWKAVFPEWISIEPEYTSGDPNPEDPRPSYAWIKVNYAKALAEDMEGEVVFTDLNVASEPVVKTVTCPGSKKFMISNAALAVTLSVEGQYNPSSTGGGGSTEPTNGYTFKATTGVDGVKFFRVARDAQGWYGVMDQNWNLSFVARWCMIEKDGATKLGDYVEEGEYWLGAQYNNDDKRYATIVALPVSMAEGLTEEDLVAASEKDIKEEYQPYILTELTQEALSGGIEFSMGAPEGITLEEMPAGDEREGIESNYSVKLVYVLTYNSFEQASMAMLDYKGYTDEYELVPIYVPAENGMDEPHGWISFMGGIGQYMTVDISDTKAPFTESRSTLVVVRNSGTYMNEFAIKVVQNVARD